MTAEASQGPPVQQLRWGIVGTGWMCSGIARAIGAVPDAQLVGVVSRRHDHAASFAREHAAEGSFADIEACIDEARPDIMYIGSPNALHAEQSIAVASRGVHVLSDKPLALTTQDAHAVRDAARAAGIRLGVNLQVRKHPAVRYISRTMEGGTIGSVVSIDVRLSMGVEVLTGWRAQAELAGGGSLHNLGAHALDLLVRLTGSTPVNVRAVQWPARAALDRATKALFEFDDGIVGSVFVSQATYGDDVGVEILGTEGRIGWSGWLAPYRSGSVSVTTDRGRSRRPAAAPDVYARVVRDFGRAVHDGHDPDPDPETAVEVVRVAEAVRDAATDGLTVRLR